MGGVVVGVFSGSLAGFTEKGVRGHTRFSSPRSPVQPIGRRHSSESRPVASAPADAQSKEDVKPPVSPVSDQETQGLSIVEPSASSTAVRLEEGVSRPFAGRRKQADEDRMGAFVTDRLVQREEARPPPCSRS